MIDPIQFRKKMYKVSSFKTARSRLLRSERDKFRQMLAAGGRSVGEGPDRDGDRGIMGSLAVWGADPVLRSYGSGGEHPGS